MDEEGGRRRCTAAFFCGRTGLFLLMTGYALLGALLFSALEGGHHSPAAGPSHVQRSRDDCLRELWLITERLNVLYERNWTRLVTEQLQRFERAVVESGKTDDSPHGPATARWTFGGALLYSLTLLTTIGYGRLAPKTALGKLVAIVYALIGVPLMLVLLSALGAVLASAARKAYAKICCQRPRKCDKSPAVGYHKAPSMDNHCPRTYEESATIQIASAHHSCRNHQPEASKHAILATVRASHTRGRRRQSQARQLLAETMPPGASISSDIEDAEEPDEHQAHDTPSRVPLICASAPLVASARLPPVPVLYAVLIFGAYVGAGAAAFVSASGWGVLDAVYFCFLALATIGVGERLPEGGDYEAQLQLLACCLYIFVGLVVVAMCFSLVQEEISTKCRHVAQNIGLGRH